MTATVAGPAAWPRARVATTARLVVCVALVLVPALEYRTWFLPGACVPLLVGAALLGGSGGTLHAVSRLRVAFVLVVVAGLVAYLVWAVYHASALPGLQMLRDVSSGVLHGAPRMWTTSAPADPTADLLALPVTVTWTAAATAGALTVGRRSSAWAVLPGLLAYLVALLLTEHRGGLAVAATALWIALAAVALALPEHDGTRVRSGAPARRSSASFGLLTVSVIAAAATTIVVATPLGRGDRRFDPRQFVSAPVRLAADVSPLSLVEGQRRTRGGAHTRLMTVHFGGPDPRPPVDARVRVADLDGYDGATWTVGGGLQRAGTRLPQVRDMGTTAPATTLDIRALHADPYGPFVPAVGAPTELHGSTCYVQPASGQLITTDTRAEDFRIETHVPHYTAEQVVRADTYSSFSHELPAPVPSSLVSLADKIAAESPTTVGRLAALVDTVRRLRYSATVPPGQSYFALTAALNRRVGNIEQHVGLAVVLARLLGIPARVAVGYRLESSEHHGTTYAVSPTDAYAWMEVPFRGLGWVSFDPVVVSRVTTTRPPPTQSIRKAESSGPQIGKPSSRGAPPIGARHRQAIWLRWILTIVMSLVVLIGAAALARPAVRRRRRRRGGAADRIVAAWRSMSETLADVRVRLPESVTPAEAADLVAGRLDERVARHLDALGPIVSLALYAPIPPDEKAAKRAWRLERGLRADCRGLQSVPRRVLAILDPRWIWVSLRRGMRASAARRAAATAR